MLRGKLATFCRSRCDPGGAKAPARMFHFVLGLGTMFDLLAGDLIRNLPRLHLQGTAALPSFHRDCRDRGAALEERRHQRQRFRCHARCSARSLNFFTDTLTADGRARRFKAERLCLRSGRVAPRSQSYQKCSGLGDSLFRKNLKPQLRRHRKATQTVYWRASRLYGVLLFRRCVMAPKWCKDRRARRRKIPSLNGDIFI
jgi:hypothetical protein